jgi:hypothetical protein
MAERIDTLPQGRPATYPWDTWMDGSAWRIRRGEDYSIPSKTMAAVIRAHGWRNGLRASARVKSDIDAVEFQFETTTEVAA